MWHHLGRILGVGSDFVCRVRRLQLQRVGHTQGRASRRTCWARKPRQLLGSQSRWYGIVHRVLGFYAQGEWSPARLWQARERLFGRLNELCCQFLPDLGLSVACPTRRLPKGHSTCRINWTAPTLHYPLLQSTRILYKLTIHPPTIPHSSNLALLFAVLFQKIATSTQTDNLSFPDPSSRLPSIPTLSFSRNH